MFLKRKYNIPSLPKPGPLQGTNLIIKSTGAREHTLSHYQSAQAWLNSHSTWPDQKNKPHADIYTSRLLIKDQHNHLVATALPTETTDKKYIGFYIQENKPGFRGFCVLREQGTLSCPSFTYIQDQSNHWHRKERDYYCTEQFKYNNGPSIEVIDAVIDDNTYNTAKNVEAFLSAFKNLPDVREIARKKLESKGHHPEHILHIDTSHMALEPNMFSDYVWVSSSIYITELDAYLEGIHPNIKDIGWIDEHVEHIKNIFHTSLQNRLPPVILPLYKTIAETQLHEHNADALAVVHDALEEKNNAKIILPDIYGYATRDMAYFVRGNEKGQFLGVLIMLGATADSPAPRAYIFRSDQDKADFFRKNKSFLKHYISSSDHSDGGIHAGAIKAIEGIGLWRPRSNHEWRPRTYFTYRPQQISRDDIQRTYGASRERDILDNPSSYADPHSLQNVKKMILGPQSASGYQIYKANIYGYPLRDMVYYDKVGPKNTFDNPDFFGVLVDYGTTTPLPRVHVFKNQQDISDFLFHHKETLKSRLNTSDLPDGRTYEGAMHAIDDIAAWVPERSNLVGWIPSSYFNHSHKIVTSRNFGHTYTEQNYRVLKATLKASYTSEAAYTGRIAAYYTSLIAMGMAPILLPFSFAGEGLIAATATGIGIGIGAADTGVNIYWASVEQNPDMKAQATAGAIMGAAGTAADVAGSVALHISARRFASSKYGLEHGVTLHTSEGPIYATPETNSSTEHTPPSRPNAPHIIGSPLRLENYLADDLSLLPKGSILFEGERTGHWYTYQGPAKKWDNTAPLFEHISFDRNGHIVCSPLDEGTFQLSPLAFQNIAQTENLPEVTVTLSKQGAAIYNLEYSYHKHHGSFRCSVGLGQDDPIKNLAHIIHCEQATDRYAVTYFGRGTPTDRTPHVQQYGEHGFGIHIDAEQVIPVQWDHDNQTWRAYVRHEPSKPTLPIKYQEETGHWIINHDTGLPGGVPGKKWAEFRERWLDKMQDYICGTIGLRQSHVTEHVGESEQRLRTLVDRGYARRTNGPPHPGQRVVTKQATFRNKSECERILSSILTETYGNRSEAQQKGQRVIQQARAAANELRASRGREWEKTFNIEVTLNNATGKGIERIDVLGKNPEYKDYEPKSVRIVIAANPNVYNGWYVKTAFPF